jgi:hypothetical protein
LLLVDNKRTERKRERKRERGGAREREKERGREREREKGDHLSPYHGWSDVEGAVLRLRHPLLVNSK